MTLTNRLLYKLYLLTMRGESMRWLPVRRWLLNRLLGRKHRGLEIHANVFIDGWWGLTLGDRVTINRGCTLLANGGLSIGDETMIAHGCSIITTQHGYDGFEPMRDQPVSFYPVKIGKDVWIGARAIILGDLADGTIVGAGSVVTKAFGEPYTTLGGVPAKIIRHRRASLAGGDGRL